MEAGAASPTNRSFTAVDLATLDDAGLADHLGGRPRPPAGAHPPALPAPRVRHGSARHVDGPPRGLGPAPGRHLPCAGRRVARDPGAGRQAAGRRRCGAGRRRRPGVAVVARRGARRVARTRPHACDEYLGDHGWRLTTGYDIEDRCLAELPDVLLASIRSAAREPGGGRGGPRRRARGAPGTGARRSTTPSSTRRSRTPGSPTGSATRTARSPTSGRPACCDGRCSSPGAASRPRAARGRSTDVFELHVRRGGGAAERRTRAGPGRDRRTGRHQAVGGHPRPAPAPRARGATPARRACSRRTSPASPGSSSPSSARSRRHRMPRTSWGIGIGTESYTGTARVVHDAAEALVAMEPGDVIVAPVHRPHLQRGAGA